MEAYWKIPKRYIHELNLTPAEALVYADCCEWNGKDGRGCSLEERAARVGMGRTTVYEILKRLQGKSIEVRIPNRNPNRNPNSPHTPLLEEQEKQEVTLTSDDARRAREREQAEGGVIGEIKKIAEELVQEIHNDGEFTASLCRLYGLTPQQQQEYVSLFVDKLTVDGTQFKSRSDFRQHFNNWLRIQVDNQHKTTIRNGNNGIPTNGTGAVTRPQNVGMRSDF